MTNKEQIVFVRPADMVYYGVYLSGDELPTGIFTDKTEAETYALCFWCNIDKEIRLIDFYEVISSLFRDRTKYLKNVSIGDNEATTQENGCI